MLGFILNIIKSSLGIKSLSDLATTIIKKILGTNEPITSKIENIKNEVIRLTNNQQITDDKTMGYIQDAKAKIEKSFNDNYAKIATELGQIELQAQKDTNTLLKEELKKSGCFYRLMRPLMTVILIVVACVPLLTSIFDIKIDHQLYDSYLMFATPIVLGFFGMRSFDKLKSKTFDGFTKQK